VRERHRLLPPAPSLDVEAYVPAMKDWFEFPGPNEDESPKIDAVDIIGDMLTASRTRRSLTFTLTAEQDARYRAWYAEVRERAKQKQVAAWEDGSDGSEEAGFGVAPYYGAVGGGYTWSFTPTGIGTVIVCKEAITGEEIDLSELG